MAKKNRELPESTLIVSPLVRELPQQPLENAFGEVLQLIQTAKQQAARAVNTELVSLYWQVGEYISRKIESAEWGDKVVADLALYLARTQPGLRGFTRPNLFRMRQFFNAYRDEPIVSALLRQLPWTHHLAILSRSKLAEEREFYVRLAIREKWSSRELERQLRASRFERTILNPPQLSTALRELQPQAAEFFKDGFSVRWRRGGSCHGGSSARQTETKNESRQIIRAQPALS
jgi:predicted nuclease of restriction endonuclease-like (RecB) superfamily